jgi:putative copper export protein/ABC-type branched-subunit amino acid transport system substrate-binding protein
VLAFSESANARGSVLSVTGPHGRVRLAALAPADGGQQLSAKLKGSLKPGVYHAHWVALGDDGHTVSGEFAFGIAEPGGAPPPGAAAALGGVGSGGRGGSASGQGAFSVAMLWLGVLAASVLWGGWLVTVALRRRGLVAREPLGRVGIAALAVSALYGAVQQATAGAGGGLDLGLLTASGTGVSALVRLAVALAGILVFRRTAARAAVGFCALASFGLSGHVLAQGNAWAALAMAAHVLAAGAWAGGLIVLLALTRSESLPRQQAMRAYTPVAITGLGIAATTGALTAIREVSHWYFLWWSGYGRLVIVKVLIVAAAVALGGIGVQRARRRLLAAETVLAAAVVAIAGTLSGLASGRGQPLPAQRGDLLAGPALSSVVLPGGPGPVTLAPARPGPNRVVVSAGTAAHSVTVRLVCGCDRRPVIARLQASAPGSFSADIPVPTAGTWDGYVTVDGAQSPSPAALPVGVAGASGAPVRNVLAVAVLSGPGAARCRNFLVGAELAIGRLNGSGGVDGGSKVALQAYDDRGSESAGTAVVRSALADAGAGRPFALLPCGAGAETAIVAAAHAGLPTIAGDPATGPVAAPGVFRLAADPYADGVATAQAIGTEVLPTATATAHTLDVVAVNDAQGQRRLAGLRSGLAELRPRLHVRLVAAATLARGDSSTLMTLLDRRHTIAMVLDGTDAQAPALAAAMARLPARRVVFAPAPVLVSERLLSEGLIEQSGDAGRVGVVQGTSTVAVDSRDGLTLSQALPALFPGQSASLESLRGYVTGLALDYGVGQGISPPDVTARLLRPAPFTDAIAEPWRSNEPAAGASQLGMLEPTFLSANLLPSTAGGEAYSGQYFPEGAWERPVTNLFGVPPRDPLPALGGGAVVR